MYVYLYSVFKLIALVHLSCVVDGESSPTFKACGRKGVTQRKAICKVHITQCIYLCRQQTKWKLITCRFPLNSLPTKNRINYKKSI